MGMNHRVIPCSVCSSSSTASMVVKLLGKAFDNTSQINVDVSQVVARASSEQKK
jgi:hypothetical protein